MDSPLQHKKLMCFNKLNTNKISASLGGEIVASLVFTGCLLSPLVTRKVLRLPELAFTNFTDSVFYLSYSQSFQELFLRHGFIYYASRFGAILPDALAFNLFGPTDAPVFLRVFLACLVSGALFLVGRRYFSPLIGILASLLWCFQPVAARLWCTTYLDSSAVPFLILGVCLLLLFRTSCAAAFFAGILLAFSVTSHLYLVILAGCLVPLVVGARWEDRRVLFLTQLPWLLGGFLLTLSVAYYWYAVNCGIGAFWQPTLELMRKMSDGDTNLWKKPWTDTLSELPLWFGPLLFLIWATFLLRRFEKFAQGAFLSLLLSMLLFWLGDAFGGSYAMSAPGYFSFLLPSLLLSLLAFAGNAARLNGATGARSLFLVCCMGMVVLPAVFKAQTNLPFWLALLPSVAIVLGCSIWLFRRQFYQISFIFCLLAFSYLTLASGFYSHFLADARRNYSIDRKIPAMAVQLKQMLPPASEGDVIRFWYPEGHDAELKMLQSFLLHTFSMLPGEVEFAKYPKMSAQDAEAIRQAGVQQVVLLDRDSARLDSAIIAMEQSGLSATQLQAQELQLGKGKIFYRRLLLKYPALKNAMSIPLESLECSPEASLALNDGKCFLTTSDLRNPERNFDFWSSLSKYDANANAVTIQGKIFHGRVDAFLIDDYGKVVSSVEIWPTDKPVSRTLYAGENRKARTLMIRNKMPDTCKSKLEVLEICLGVIVREEKSSNQIKMRSE